MPEPALPLRGEAGVTYAKLFGSILYSTIWQAPDHVRLVWITMLAMKDQDGIVEASVPGLAKAANVSVDLTRDALAALQAPDPDSRTPDHEGRRIESVDGGWRVLNHEKYRAKEALAERRAKEAARTKQRRDEGKLPPPKRKRDASGRVRNSPETSGRVRNSPECPPSETETDHPDREPASVAPGPVPAPSGDLHSSHGGDHEQARAVPAPVNRGWPRTSGAQVPAAPPPPNARDDRAGSRVSDPPGDPLAAERSRLLRVLPQLHVERFRAVKQEIGAAVPDLALPQAERAVREHLLQQPTLEGYEDRARHVLAVREAEARRPPGSLRYFGVGVWREPAWGMATTMEIEAPAASARVGRIEPAPADPAAATGSVDLRAIRDGGTKS